MKALALIVNPAAAGGRPVRALPGVERTLGALGGEHRVAWTRDLAHARELAHAAARAGEVAVAFGGDGLVAAVADALRHSGGVLGILPGGRGNDFARGLGIPLEPEAACATLLRGRERMVDLGDVAGVGFIGIASCGFDSDANRIANQARAISGSLVYVYGALRALLMWRSARFEVTLDDQPTRWLTGYSVAAANSQAYGGGMYLAPEASLDDGMLDVVMIGQVSKARFLALLPTVFSGRHVRLANVHVARCREVRIACDRPFTLYADGDPIAELPVTVRAVPGAVRVRVPQ